METAKQNNWKKPAKIILLLALLFVLPQCYQDDDMNYRILIENHCDFALKVYYDNQDIEYDDDYGSDVSVTGSVSLVMPFDSKIIHSKYSSVWIEPDASDLKAGKFRSVNDGSWRKRIDVYEEDFRINY